VKVELYHKKVLGFPFDPMPNDFPEGYDKVADLDVGGKDWLEQVFKCTNHIDSDWTKNPQVKKLYGLRQRSTSVSDVVVNGTERWYCAPIGWVRF
jgi:hypothetical protein